MMTTDMPRPFYGAGAKKIDTAQNTHVNKG